MSARPPVRERISRNPIGSATSSRRWASLVKDGKDADGNPVTTWEIAR